MSRRESSTSPRRTPPMAPRQSVAPTAPHPYLPTSGSVSHTRRSFAPSTARKSMRPSEGTRRTITGRPHRTSVQRVGGLRFAATGTGYYGLHVEGDDGGTSMASAHSFLTTAVAVRDSYKEMDGGKVESPERLTPPIGLRLEDGIFYFSDQCTPVVPWEKYYEDLQTLIQCIQHPRVNAACEHRLQVMEEQFNVYRIFNQEMEESADRYRRGGGVFSDAVKVDNFVKLPYSMSAPWLVSYIRERMEEQGEDVVAMQGDGFKREPINLSKVCTLLEFNDPDWVSVEGLGLQPMLDRRRLTRVDITDPEFNSAGRQSATLLQLFLSPYTVNKGAYLADAVRVVLEANEELERGPRATETLVEISGLQEEEWERLAEWMYEQDLLETYRTNRWLISISPSPPIVGKGTEGSTTENTFEIGPKFNTSLENHQQQLENIFLPLFQATVAPEDAKNVHVAGLLANVGAFVVQCGDALGRRPLSAKRRRPVDVPWSEKVPVSYFLYYVWTNLSALNALRKRCGLNTIQLRTKLSSQSSPEALAVSYMLCDHIIDGTALEAHPAMQYLFGLHRIGVCMSPTYSNALGGVPYIENPFAKFFRRGLRVSLATFAPLLTHTSSEPLTEEYGNVARVCRLSGVDLSEIGLNSAWISSFPDELKSEWLGSDVGQQDWRGNNVEFTNVPTARLELRSRVWTAERNVLRRCEGLEPLSGSDSDDELTSAAVGQDGKRKSDSHFKGGDAPYVVTDPHVDFPRLILTGPYDRDMQHGAAAQRLHRVLELRNQYMLHLHRIEDRCPSESAAVYFNSIENQDPVQQMELAFHKDAHRNFEEEEWMFKTVEGVVVPHEVHQIPRLPQNMYHFGDFCSHVEEVRSIAEDAHVRQFANRRLQLLEHRFRLHIAVNAGREAGSTAEKASQNRDFYQATKVDNTVRMETGMTARQLLDFIVSKAANNGDDIVSHRSGREPQTLRQLLHELDISPDTLTVDNLGVQADGTIGMAKESFYPEGRDELLTLLLKTENQMKGRYFAELTKSVFENLKRDRFTFSENRLPIYGSSEEEWGQLSSWFDTHGMASSHNQWVVQVPRIYSHLRQQGKVESFAHYLENIFKPLWSVSLHPSRNPRLFHFVNHISGFDSVEDESRPDTPLSSAMVPPHEWTSEEEPPYNYYMYYMWANIYSLNAFRRRRHFTSFTFRPSCGQCGSMDHLIGGLLLANSISYGVLLGEEDGPLQYLFYLARIGCTLSPLSNNSNVCGYLSNPFYRLFRRGLFVSLGTDSPLMYHHTQEPLIEEYSIASKIWKLTQNDMCEIARNSVLISGFSPAFKQEQLGERFFLSSSIGNDASCTHLSDVRVSYRFETYHSELGFLEFVSGLTFNRALYTLAEEEQWQQTLEARKAAQRDNKPLQDALIEANPDEADLERLQQQRTTLQQQMEEVNHTLNELRRQNKQLSEKLSEERARDAQAALLRRQRAEVTLSNFGDIQQHLQLQRLMNSQQLQSGVGTPNGEFLPAGTMTSHESKISFVSDGHSSKHGVGTPLHMATDSNHDSNNNNNNNNNNSGEGAAAGSPDALLGYSEVLWNSNNTKPRKNKESSVTLPRL